MSAASLIQQRNLIPYQPGQSGNPAGRPIGARHKIKEAFLKDFLAEWEATGPDAIHRLAMDEPAVFVKLAADLAAPAIAKANRDNPNAGVLFDAASFVVGALVGRAGGHHARDSCRATCRLVSKAPRKPQCLPVNLNAVEHLRNHT